MSDSQLRSDIGSKFGAHVASNDILVSECVEICKLYGLSGEDLFYKWEALAYSSVNRSHGIFNHESAAHLRTSLQRSLANDQAKLREKQARVARVPGNLTGISSAGKLAARNFGNARASASSKSKALPAYSAGRQDTKVTGPSRVAFSSSSTSDQQSQRKCTGSSWLGRVYDQTDTLQDKYMYEKITDRGEALDKRIDQFAELATAYYNIEEFGNPSQVTEDRIYVIGRTALDAESTTTGSVKMNEASIVLEPSRATGVGGRVPIKFHTGTRMHALSPAKDGLGFFPGSIVAFKGKNGGGGWFLVDEILPMPLVPQSSVKLENNRFDMCIACGPFTADTDLEYSNWQTLSTKLASTKPDVLLLIGPFVDSTHPKVVAGDVDETPEQIFAARVRELVVDYLNLSPGSIAVIVPSVRDLMSDHAVFPQAELSKALFNDTRVHQEPNPSQFSINGIKIAATSTDVLFHIRKEEFHRSISRPGDETATPADVLANTSRNLLLQRSFYPMFPVPVDHAAEVNLDVTHSDAGLRLGDEQGHMPSILVLPSRLKYFVKNVEGTIVINPSYVGKSMFAHVSYDPNRPVGDYIRVENQRII